MAKINAGLNFEELEQRLLSETYRVQVEIPKKPEGYGKENYVYDEDKTVRWNREHQKELENKYKEERKQFDEASAGKRREMVKDFIDAISKEYGFNGVQAEIIFNRAYEDAHDVGMLEVLNKARDYAEMIKDVIEEEIY